MRLRKLSCFKLVEMHPDNNNVKVALGQCHLERFKQLVDPEDSEKAVNIIARPTMLVAISPLRPSKTTR